MSTYTAPLTGTFAADPIHSSFGFAVKYMGISTFRGTMGSVTAKLEIGPDGAALNGAAKVESISIRNPEQFRAHVLGDQFFGAETHPEVTFASDRIVLDEDGSATIDGRLTIKGITRPVKVHGTWTLPAADPMGHTRTHMSLQATVNRRDFDMNWDAPLPSGGSALADDVTLAVELALVAKDHND